MTEASKGACTGCTRTDVSITATGGLRVHAANGKRVGPDNPACPGSGQKPKAEQAGPVRFLCRVPAGPGGCGHEVQLTANHRARSHLNGQDEQCIGGSDHPIALDADGVRNDTIGWTEELWEKILCPVPSLGDVFAGEARNGTIRPTEVVDLPHDRTDDLDRFAPPAGPETDAEKMSRLTAAAVEILGRRTPEQKLETARRMDETASRELGLPRSPELCDHEWGPEVDQDEDGQDTVVTACKHCGLIDPCTCTTSPGDLEGPAADCPVHGRIEPGPADWHCPPDIRAKMPEGVRRLAEDNPECWECGHEVTPLAERFEPDGSVLARHVVWTCSAAGGGSRCPDTCGVTPSCRPQHPTEARLSDLDEGAFFVRHTAKAPLDKLVYRLAEHESRTAVLAAIVTPGPYLGRSGPLTNLTEEVTCTDQTGRAVPRRDRASGTTSPSTPNPGPRSTPSAPRTGPDPTTVPAPGSRPTTKASAPAATSTTSSPGTVSGRTAGDSGGTSTRTAPVTDAFSTPKQAVNQSEKYDNYGRYKMLHPVTGKKVNWTRATTFCKSIQDTYALSMWSQRMVLKGASIRSDLTAAAGTLEVKADKDRMNGLVDEAKKAAGDKIAANKGTAVHAYTEQRDKTLVGMEVELKTVPEEFVPTVEAYAAVLQDFGLEPVPGLIEFSTGVVQYDIGGTADRVYRVTRDITISLNGRPVTLYAGEYILGDLKTGADLSYGWQEIAIQLALYSQGLNTSGVWDWGTRTWGRPADANGVQIQVRTDIGLVPHLPVDRSATKAPLATLYAVDLTAGWAAAVLCAQVRSWRKERKLATPLEVADVAVDPGPDRLHPEPQAPVSRPAPASRPVTLADKARAVTSRAEASAVYQEAVAARTPVAEVNALVQLMQDKLKSFTEQGA
jgi:hypothetical protein